MALPIILSVGIGILTGGLMVYLLGRSFGGGGSGGGSQTIGYVERDAENMLAKAGYQIIEKRPRGTVIAKIDGQERFGYLEADYLVAKNKRNFAVLVKTGEGEVDLNEENLRQKLLAYDYAFAPDAMLLLDMNKGELHTVYFRFPREGDMDRFFKFMIALFIVALVIGIIWVLSVLKVF